jgi:hypothetical protein
MRRMYPARSNSLWLGISASAGSSRRVTKSISESRIADFLKIPDDCNLRLTSDIIRGEPNLIKSLNKFWKIYQKARAVFDNCHHCTLLFQQKFLNHEKEKFVLEPNLSRLLSEVSSNVSSA